MQTKNDLSLRPVARFSTSLGSMNVSLFKDLTPKNVSNFLHYVVNGKYDNIFFTRAVSGFVIQGGGLDINSSNQVTNVAPFTTVVQGEPGVSNTRGRLSLALSGGPNTGSKEFFFNLTNNTSLDVAQPGQGPFTAFGEVNSASGLAVMDAIGARPTIDFSSQGISTPGTLTNQVPVNNQSQANAGLNPTRDLIIISRIAVLMKIGRI
jgi:cyclophilin family peptidyl-prolyl cis-trans isomerase